MNRTTIAGGPTDAGGPTIDTGSRIEPALGRARVLNLPAGPIRIYERGSGPTIVFIHGMSVNAVAWRKVVPLLADDFHCVTADWPFGAHTMAMRDGVDLSAPGIADIIATALEELGVSDVILVGNDGGGLLSQLVVTRHPERIGGVVLTNCDAYENFPPPDFAYLCRLARLPLIGRVGPTVIRRRMVAAMIARSRRGFGALHRHPVEPRVIEHYLTGPRTSPGVFGDFLTFLRSVDKEQSLAAASRFGEVEQPVLILWAPDDPVFPERYAHRLAADFPHSRLELLADSATWVGEDQPESVAAAVRRHITDRHAAS